MVMMTVGVAKGVDLETPSPTYVTLAPTPWFLVSNTRANEVVKWNIDGTFPVVQGTTDDGLGLDSNDDIVEYQGSFFFSTGTLANNSAIVKCTDDSCEVFATGGGMHRPYGLAFGGHADLYVASFLTDAILKFDAMTGAFITVFAQGDGTEAGLVNGPNDIAYDPDTNRIYVTTQGSVAVDGSPDFSFGLQSKVIAFDLITGKGSTFVQDVVPIGPFVSLLGIKIKTFLADGRLLKKKHFFVSDFAGGVRLYDDDGLLRATYATAIPLVDDSLPIRVGNIDFLDDSLYIAAFINSPSMNWPGAILQYDNLSSSFGDRTDVTALNGGPTTDLVRPIGLLVI